MYFIKKDAYGKYLSYATLGGYVPCLGAEVFKFPWRLIFSGFSAGDEQKPKLVSGCCCCCWSGRSGRSERFGFGQSVSENVSQWRSSHPEMLAHLKIVNKGCDIKARASLFQCENIKIHHTQGHKVASRLLLDKNSSRRKNSIKQKYCFVNYSEKKKSWSLFFCFLFWLFWNLEKKMKWKVKCLGQGGVALGLGAVKADIFVDVPQC